MSGIPFTYFAGLGAVPSGRADPEACARLTEEYQLYKKWEALTGPGMPNRDDAIAQKNIHKARWLNLKNQNACRAEAATPASTQTPKPESASVSSASAPRQASPTGSTRAPRSSVSPYSMAIQQFTTTEREPVSSLFSSPAALVSAGGGVPWKPVLGIAAVLGGIAAIVYFVRRPETPEDQWLS